MAAPTQSGSTLRIMEEKSYKAVRCPTPNAPWEVVALSLRQPGAEQVLIKVHASGICNSDHFVKDGSWPGLEYPRIPGHEVIGRVAAVGDRLLEDAEAAKRCSIGALVGIGWNGGFCNACDYCRRGDFWTCRRVDYTGFTIDGGLGEYVYAPYTALVSIPEEALSVMSYAELAPLCCAGASVFGAINTSKWSPGDICLVQGVGGLGHLAIQYASRLGMKVYAASSGGAKKDLALSLGATEFLDSSSVDVVQHMQSLGGANLIICTAPYARSINSIIPAVARNGVVTLVSATTDGPIEVQNLLLNMNRASIRGYSCGTAVDMEECIKYSVANKVKPIVQEFAMDSFPSAYEAVMENKARFRNVVVFPESELI